MKWLSKGLLAGVILLNSFVVESNIALSQTHKPESKPVVLSVQVKEGKPLYRLNGKIVENRRENSLLNNLMQVVNERGNKIPVFLIIDERAPFTEASKLQTALDKIDMPNRRMFIADFLDGTMNEIRVERKAVPIPKD